MADSAWTGLRVSDDQDSDVTDIISNSRCSDGVALDIIPNSRSSDRI